MSDRNTTRIKNIEEEQNKEEELKNEFNRFLHSIGYQGKKIQLLNALLEIKEGTPSKIAEKAGLGKIASKYAYDHLHNLAEEIDAIEETVSPTARKTYYIKDVAAVYENIGETAINGKNEIHEKEVERLKSQIQEIIKLAKNVFVLRTGVVVSKGDFSYKKIESGIELDNRMEGVATNAERRFLFLARTGTKIDYERHIKPLKKKPDDFDCRVITIREEKESKYLERIFSPPEKIIHRYLTHFDEKSKLWYPIRFIIHDDSVLIFEWEGKKEEKMIKWAIEIEDKYFSTLLAMAFDHLWEHHTE